MTCFRQFYWFCVAVSLVCVGCSDDPIPAVGNSTAPDAFVGTTVNGDTGTVTSAVDMGGISEAADMETPSSLTDMELAADAQDSIESWAQTVDDLIGALGQIEAGPPPNTGITVGIPSDPEKVGNFYCTTQSMSQTAQFNEYIASQANSNALWVGALIQGQALRTGMLTEASVPRRPLTISVGLEGLNGPSSAQLDTPSLSAYRQAVQDILSNGMVGSQPAQINYSTETIHSESHLALFLGADVSAGAVDVSTAFDFTRSEVRSRMIVNFVQAYYTVDMDALGRASNFFAPLTAPDLIRNAFGGDMAESPLYVSSITYGRRVVFTAESTASASELKAALEFAYDGIGAEVNVNARMSHQEVLDESNIQAFILGGSADDAVGAINGLAGIQAYIMEGGTFSLESPGAPIAYKLNHLSDNSAARLSLTTDYDKEVCERVRQNVRVTLMGITPRDGQSNAKTYGTILTRSFDEEGNEAMHHFLFNKAKSDRISMDENQEWQPANIGVSGLLPAVASLEPEAAGARIQLEVRLKEFDSIGNDDDVDADLYLSPADGWRQGCGSGEDLVINAAGNRQSYDVRFCLQPMPD